VANTFSDFLLTILGLVKRIVLNTLEKPLLARNIFSTEKQVHDDLSQH